MGLVREIADAVRLLKEVVLNTRELVTAIRDGRQFLRSKFPEAEPQFQDLLKQMRKTVVGLAEVTSVVSDFSFTVEGKAMDFEAQRFNNYVATRASRLTKLRGQIRRLKGSSGAISDIRDDLDRLAGKSDWWSPMFRLLGVSSKKQADELARRLSNFYADDARMVEAIMMMLRVAEQVIEEVNEALGGAGGHHPSRVPVAAKVLETYAAAFKQSRADLDSLEESMTEQIAKLKGRR